MGKMERWLENMSEKEDGKQKQEAGRDPAGEMSEEELKKWLRWALATLFACVVLAGIWAAVSSVRNRKEAAILEVDSGTVLELYLNRKGVILKAKGAAENVLNDYSLEEGIDKLLDGLAEYGRLEEGGAVIFTLRQMEGGIQTDLERLVEEIYMHSELFLRKRHSGGTVYVDVLEGDEIAADVVSKYGVSYGKAALAKNLLDKNTELKNSDLVRLLRTSVDEISAEISEEKYDTTFVIVTAKQVYTKWQEMGSEIEETSLEILNSEDIAAESVSEDTEKFLEETAQEVGVSGTADENENIQEGQVVPENVREAEDAQEVEGMMEITSAATKEPTITAATTEAPTQETTAAPTQETTEAPTQETTAAPTQAPTVAPTTAAETQAPTEPETTAVLNHGTLSPAPGSAAGGSIIQEVIPISPGN